MVRHGCGCEWVIPVDDAEMPHFANWAECVAYFHGKWRADAELGEWRLKGWAKCPCWLQLTSRQPRSRAQRVRGSTETFT
jgi:hypothetical protein